MHIPWSGYLIFAIWYLILDSVSRIRIGIPIVRVVVVVAVCLCLFALQLSL